MFADAAVAARIDRAEGRLSSEVAQAVAARGTGERVLVRPLSGGLAVFAGRNSPANKVIGVGFELALDGEALAAIEAEWRERGEPVRVEMSVLAEPSLGPSLSRRGYRLHGFENVLGRRLDAEDRGVLPPHVSVEVLREVDVERFIEIAVAAFLELDGTGSPADDGLPRAELERVLRDFAAVPSLVRYLARIDGEPAGIASLRLDLGLAQVAGAGTLPAFRGRGVQKALVSRRLADAYAAGCDLAVVTTAPGTRSQANVMRRGFELLYTRAVLVKSWDEEASAARS